MKSVLRRKSAISFQHICVLEIVCRYIVLSSGDMSHEEVIATDPTNLQRNLYTVNYQNAMVQVIITSKGGACSRVSATFVFSLVNAFIV